MFPKPPSQILSLTHVATGEVGSGGLLEQTVYRSNFVDRIQRGVIKAKDLTVEWHRLPPFRLRS